MRKAGALKIIGVIAVLTLLALATGCGGGGGHSSIDQSSGEGNTDPGTAVTFTYALDSGLVNSLPAGADHISVVLDGKETNVEIPERIIVYPEAASAETGTTTRTLTFYVDPGQHTFSIYALKGTEPIGTPIGPITFTKVQDIPAIIPLAFDFTGFENSRTYTGTDAVTPYFGTPERDRIVQYGGLANDSCFFWGNAGNDWIEQYGGNGDDSMWADGGTEGDFILQSGGDGNDTMKASSGCGNDWIFQYAGSGDDTVESMGSDDDDVILVDGEEGNDAIYVNPGLGNDKVTISAGSGIDTITYEVNPGTDTASIDGGDGTDVVTIKENGNSFLIKDSGGNPLYHTPASGDTTITVANVEAITVLDQDGKPLFTWISPYFATSKADVGTDSPDNLNSIRTPDRDYIIQFGGAGNDQLSVSMDAENDWSAQYGGEGDDAMVASTGTGNDVSYQEGGAGNDSMYVSSADGDDVIYEKGGDGNDTLNCQAGDGNDTVNYEGGVGNDTLNLTLGYGNDAAAIDAGDGDDTITYDVSPGTDTIRIDGGDGIDTLTVNRNGFPVIVRDYDGNILYNGGTGGTTITVIVEHMIIQ